MRKGLPKTSPVIPSKNPWPGIFSGLFGALLGLALVKFGNPVISEELIDWPTNGYEWLLNNWPVVIGYWLLAGVTIVGLAAARWKRGLPLSLVAMPLLWLVWELVSATQTQSPRLTTPTLIHFCTCVVCFYLGLFSLSGVQRCWPFWIGILAGFFFVMCSGFQQHFGGLEQSQKYWFTYVYPKLTDVPVAEIKKMQSNRIFATLFYPNTLAGVILMLLPAILAVLWSMRERFTTGARALLMSLATTASLGCLYWSGSKSGWLLMLIIITVGALCLPIKRQIKIAFVALVLMLGLAGFIAKNLGYFQKGATSVNARFDYWEAGLAIAKEHPIFGTGPGTFSKSYQRRKRPDSEMARMAHNDYLQQASDSGVPGFLAYATLVVGVLIHSWRRAGLREDWVKLAVWLGVFAWALQSLVEFGLYIPAISWLAFGLMGWLFGEGGNQIDSRKMPS